MERKDVHLLWQAVEYWAERTPDREALAFGSRRMTWRELNAAVNHTAKAFLEAGVERGDRIALIAMARVEFIVTFMAASKIGAIWLGLSPKFSRDELGYLVGHSQPAVLIALNEYMGTDLVEMGLSFQNEFPAIRHFLSIGGNEHGVAEFSEYVAPLRPEWDAALDTRAGQVHPDDDVLLMYTSGSTGKPKGVLHTHRSVINNISVEVEHFDFDDTARCLLHFPINHVAADVELAYGALYAGAALILLDRFDPAVSLEIIERERVTHVGQVPAMYSMQAALPRFATLDWSHVRAFIWGGSATPRRLLDLLEPIALRTGARLITGYGSTELCGFVSYTAPGETREHLEVSAGRVVPPYEVKIVDEFHRTIPNDSTGEIAIRGPVLMTCYFNDPKATTDAIDDDGWYYTRDLGSIDEEGYLYIAGRCSEMFKSGGENIYPKEIEDVLERHPDVLAAAVVGEQHDVFDEVGHAFVVLKPQSGVTPEALCRHCREHLANFKVPKYIEIRELLPVLPTGKINKMILRRELKRTSP